MGTYKSDAYDNPLWTSEFAVYIANPDHLNDLINIWNYRALGWNILAIPHGSLTEPYYREQIERQQIEFHKYRRLIERIKVIANYEMSREVAHECIDQLSAIQANPEKQQNIVINGGLPDIG